MIIIQQTYNQYMYMVVKYISEMKRSSSDLPWVSTNIMNLTWILFSFLFSLYLLYDRVSFQLCSVTVRDWQSFVCFGKCVRFAWLGFWYVYWLSSIWPQAIVTYRIRMKNSKHSKWPNSQISMCSFAEKPETNFDRIIVKIKNGFSK